MEYQPLIECIPNFSEGQSAETIQAIKDAIETVPGIQLLHMDSGQAAHRTVFTFIGPPDQVVEAAYWGIKEATERIDMNAHAGKHPRIGATDVCPLVPLHDVDMEDCIRWSHILAERVSKELALPVYMYEASAKETHRKLLGNIRKGGFEGLKTRMSDPLWKPDYGPSKPHPKAGAIVIGARPLLVAFNVNLGTSSVALASEIAKDVRESGRWIKKNNTKTHQPGHCKHVRALGWFIEEYSCAQVSMNLTDIEATPLHVAYEAVVASAKSKGVEVRGSELIGLVPLEQILQAGRFSLHQKGKSSGVPQEKLIKEAIRYLGLNHFGDFNPQERILDFRLATYEAHPVRSMTIGAYVDQLSEGTPTPGGGAAAALAGSLAAGLATMVSNITAHQKRADESFTTWSSMATQGQQTIEQWLTWSHEDNQAFEGYLQAATKKAATPVAEKAKHTAVQAALKHCIEVPLQMMRGGMELLVFLEKVMDAADDRCLSDVGVAIHLAKATIEGSALVVHTNILLWDDEDLRDYVLMQMEEWLNNTHLHANQLIRTLQSRITN